MGPPKKGSPIWQVFQLDNVDANIAVCQLCSCRMRLPKHGTGYLCRHVKRIHPGFFNTQSTPGLLLSFMRRKYRDGSSIACRCCDLTWNLAFIQPNSQ